MAAVTVACLLPNPNPRTRLGELRSDSTHRALRVVPEDLEEAPQQARPIRKQPDARQLPESRKNLFHLLQPEC